MTDRGRNYYIFYCILFRSITVYSILFHSILFCCVLLYSILFYSVFFYSILFCSILFYSILFHSILFRFILFCSVLFYSILLYSILFYSTIFFSVLFYSILSYSILFCSILFCFVLFYSVLFYSTLFYYVLFCSILFYSILFCSILFYSVLFCSILFFYCYYFLLLASSISGLKFHWKYYIESHKKKKAQERDVLGNRGVDAKKTNFTSELWKKLQDSRCLYVRGDNVKYLYAVWTATPSCSPWESKSPRSETRTVVLINCSQGKWCGSVLSVSPLPTTLTVAQLDSKFFACEETKIPLPYLQNFSFDSNPVKAVCHMLCLWG